VNCRRFILRTEQNKSKQQKCLAVESKWALGSFPCPICACNNDLGGLHEAAVGRGHTAHAGVELGVQPATIDSLTGGIVHTVATAHVSGSGVGANGLEGAGHGSGGDVCGTEVVHEGGVGPEVVDGRAVGEHALPALACMCELLAHKGKA
jgi:hypothetical protein